MPSRIIPTPATFRRLGRSRRMRNPNRNTQIKLVAVIIVGMVVSMSDDF